MKILVTGSEGTLGQPLVRELQRRGNVVFRADLQHGLDVIRTDVTEARQVYRTFDKIRPDVCYHLAAEFGRINGQEYYEQLWKTNCLGTRNIIEACVQHQTRMIFSSSSEAYGSLADNGPLTESRLDKEVPSFHNEYALSKWTNEQQIRTAIKNSGLNATILRFFNVYGPGEKYSNYRSVICLFIYRCLKGLPSTVYTKTHRSFLYIDDWTKAVANACEHSILSGEAFNIGSPSQYNLSYVYEHISSVTGCMVKPTLIDNETSNIADKRPSLDKASTLLGLKESVDLWEGINRTVKWMRKEYCE